MEPRLEVDDVKRLPRTRLGREYESNVHEYRVKRGLTVKKLAEYAGTNVNMIVSLANGTVPPISHGEVKPIVAILCEILDGTVEELFPRYPFKISTCREGATDEQIKDALYPNTSTDRLFDFKEFNEIVESELDPKELEVIRCRYYDETPVGVTAEVMRLTPEGVRTIEARALRKLRKQYSAIRSFRSMLEE